MNDLSTVSTRPISMLAVFRTAVYEAIAARDAIVDVCSHAWSAANEEVRLAKAHLNAELSRINNDRLDTDFGGDTVREAPAYVLEEATDVGVRHVGRSRRAVTRLRQIRATRQDIDGLRHAMDEGWNVGPELAHEERRLAVLEAEERRSARTIEL